MKLTTAIHVLRSLVAVLCLFGAFLFSATRAEAQVQDLASWKTEAESMPILLSQIHQIGQNLVNLTPGTQPYDNAEAHAGLYKLVYRSLLDGHSVPEAITAGFQELTIGASGAANDPQLPAQQALRAQLYTDIAILLKA